MMHLDLEISLCIEPILKAALTSESMYSSGCETIEGKMDIYVDVESLPLGLKMPFHQHRVWRLSRRVHSGIAL